MWRRRWFLGRHLTPDQLRAVYEERLEGREKRSVEDHLSHCRDCQQLVFNGPQAETVIDQAARSVLRDMGKDPDVVLGPAREAHFSGLTLMAYARGDVDREMEGRVCEHIKSCPTCEWSYEAFRQTNEMYPDGPALGSAESWKPLRESRASRLLRLLSTP